MAALTALLVGFAVTRPTDEGLSKPQRRVLLVAYTAAVEPLAKEGGSVVVLGLKPGLTDIGQGRFPRARLVQMATGWVGALERTSTAFAAVLAPGFLTEAKANYDRSLRLYVKTAKTLLAAARAGGEQRRALVARAAERGRRADASFDRAKAIVDKFRTQLGLPTESNQP